MKKVIRFSFGMILLGAVAISGCKSTQKAAAPAGEKEVLVYCSGPDYFTSDKAFRANSIGESMDQATSQNIAMTNARNQLAQAIQTTVKTVTDNYTKSASLNKTEDLEQKFESLNREVVNQTLSGVKTICQKVMQTTDNRYKTYVAIELTADDLLKKYNERLSTDAKLKIDYDYTKFKETFDKEMEKMKQDGKN